MTSTSETDAHAPQADERSFYITTPIFYPNANLHMGHAYTVTVCDILARYHRLKGDATYLLTGTDENTGKVTDAAETAGKDVATFLDDIVDTYKTLFADLDISYDQFIRTSDQERHWPGAQEMWRRLEAAGDIYKDTYNGLYCRDCEAFLTERDLVDGKCPDHDTRPEEVEEENYFFRLSRYTDQIAEKMHSGGFQVLPKERENEVLSMLDEGLGDVSFSRPKEKVSWGIPVPGDEAQVIYVWCDALTNYISALGFGRENQQLFDRFWPADVHVIGKDILKFHAAFWPAMLMSAGMELSDTILVHGMITSGGYKMSKSRGNVIAPYELINEYGTDALRYYLARHISPFSDGDLTIERFEEVYNADLANGIGNLASRVLKMYVKFGYNYPTFSETQKMDQDALREEYESAFNRFELTEAANVVWRRIANLDQYITDSEPFKKIKEDEQKAKDDIGYLVHELFEIAVMLEPIMPDTAQKIKTAINNEESLAQPLFPRKE